MVWCVITIGLLVYFATGMVEWSLGRTRATGRLSPLLVEHFAAVVGGLLLARQLARCERGCRNNSSYKYLLKCFAEGFAHAAVNGEIEWIGDDDEEVGAHYDHVQCVVADQLQLEHVLGHVHGRGDGQGDFDYQEDGDHHDQHERGRVGVASIPAHDPFVCVRVGVVLHPFQFNAHAHPANVFVVQPSGLCRRIAVDHSSQTSTFTAPILVEVFLVTVHQCQVAVDKQSSPSRFHLLECMVEEHIEYDQCQTGANVHEDDAEGEVGHEVHILYAHHPVGSDEATSWLVDKRCAGRSHRRFIHHGGGDIGDWLLTTTTLVVIQKEYHVGVVTLHEAR